MKQIHLCKSCHQPIPEIGWNGYNLQKYGALFCSIPCSRQFKSLSQEAQSAAHYEWVRQEALANSQSELFS